MMISRSIRLENTVGKGANAGVQSFFHAGFN